MLLVVGASVLGLGLVSRPLKRWGLPDPLVLLLLGIALGPRGLGVLVPGSWGDPWPLLEQTARLTLAVGLMGVALRLPRRFPTDHARSIGLLLALAMPFMWAVTSGLVGGLLGLTWWPALLVGAILTPTDPVVSSAIVTGSVADRNVPAGLRNLLSSESGFNDGLGYPFVLLPILMLKVPAGEAMGRWLGRVVLWEVLGALAIGAALGFAAGRALRFAERHRAMEEPSFLAYTTALALLTVSLASLAGSDGILAVFVSGLAFDQVVRTRDQQRELNVTEGFDRFFTLPIFILLGALIPWAGWARLGWAGVGLATAILLLRRLPLVLLLKGRLAELAAWRDAVFLGWYGPMGVAALYYVALATRETGLPELWPAVSLVVCASIAVHGATATPGARWYGRRVSRSRPSQS